MIPSPMVYKHKRNVQKSQFTLHFYLISYGCEDVICESFKCSDYFSLVEKFDAW